jgi:hypothetical protein
VKAPFYFLLFAFIAIGCSDENQEESTEKNSEQESSAEAVAETTIPSTFELFDAAFVNEEDSSIPIDVVQELFPEHAFISDAEADQKIEFHPGITGYRFTNIASHYLAIYDTHNEPQLITSELLYEDAIRDMDFELREMALGYILSMYTIGEPNLSYAYFIVTEKGELKQINNLTSNDIPEKEEEMIILTTEEILGERYMVVQTTDESALTYLHIYDLDKEEKIRSMEAIGESYFFSNDTLNFMVPGEFLGDTMGLGKIAQVKYQITNGEVVDSILTDEYFLLP